MSGQTTGPTPEAHVFGGRSWARALTAEVNGSSEYRNAAAGWGDGWNGNLLFRFEADAALVAPRSLLIRLARGACQGAEFIDTEGHPEAAFSLAAPFTLWREILERKTLAATAILTGRMKVGGDKLALLRHTAAHRALIHCAASVPTIWG